jgi:hypothetical protein
VVLVLDLQGHLSQEFEGTYAANNEDDSKDSTYAIVGDLDS